MRSSPGPKTGCSVHADHSRHSGKRVAILTRSEDRVQQPVAHHVAHRPDGCDPHPVRRPGAARHGGDRGNAAPNVAILTRSEDRVQHRQLQPLRAQPARCCDPHPVRRPGAAANQGLRTLVQGAVAILTRSEDRVQRPDTERQTERMQKLRSSPGPKTGCSIMHAAFAAHTWRVAILTRSEDRVQQGISFTLTICQRLRSSPGPKTGCSGS